MRGGVAGGLDGWMTHDWYVEAVSRRVQDAN